MNSSELIDPIAINGKYLEWIYDIILQRTAFLSSFAAIQADYQTYLNAFIASNPGYASAPVGNLQPIAMFNIINNSACPH